MSLIEDLLSLETDYSKPERSFSPLFSNFGICFDKAVPGISCLLLHYNRTTRDIWNPLLQLNGTVSGYDFKIDSVSVYTEKSELQVSYYDTDALLINCKTTEPISLLAHGSSDAAGCWFTSNSSDSIILQGYSRNRDVRDPDPCVPFLCGMKAIQGELLLSDSDIQVIPDQTGEILIAFAADVMDISSARLINKLESAPQNIDIAKGKIRTWLEYCIGSTLISPGDEKTKIPFLQSISTLLMNLAKAPGYLKSHIASFPNRGGYPTHFLWDSAFQNLAFELMNPALARDAILQLTDNIRPDGKIPQFICSTWARPSYSQPALVGWMALRYLDSLDHPDDPFIRQVLPALEANSNWWLTHRMTRYGLLFCQDGLETGQDDSPRFDNGPILALDMNSYLINQMRCTAELQRRSGQSQKAEKWDTKADELAALIVQYLYDPAQNIFFDADAMTCQKLSIITPCAFLPLWCGVPLAPDQINKMIQRYLLDPSLFFGNVPFPSVAYDQPCYDPQLWWRGPTWMPQAWLMLEVLHKYGFAEARDHAIRKIAKVMIADGKNHELFNSASGQGLGNEEQGWSAAILIRIVAEICFGHSKT